MSKAEQIRAMAGHLKPREVAAMIGCTPHYVACIRSRAKNPDLYRRIFAEAARRWRARNHDRALAYSRGTYHRSKKLGGIGHTRWSREHSMLLVVLHTAGRTYSEIATEMNISRSTVAGRIKRLRDAGEIA